MFQELGRSIRVLLVLTILTGVAYPLVVTAAAQTFFNHEANGSLVRLGGKVVGSELIGQSFSDPKYFWGRLSATTPAYNAAASSGSNYGPLNPALKDAVASRVKALREADPGNRDPVPVDLVTASGSGLDPHISPASALYQAGRVARARGLEEGKVRELVGRLTESRWLGLIGEPVVNVLRINLALDHINEPGGQPSEARGRNLPRFMKWGPAA